MVDFVLLIYNGNPDTTEPMVMVMVMMEMKESDVLMALSRTPHTFLGRSKQNTIRQDVTMNRIENVDSRMYKAYMPPATFYRPSRGHNIARML